MESILNTLPIREKLTIPHFLNREKRLNRRIYEDMQKCMNVGLPIKDRTAAWENSLKTVINKKLIAVRVGQSLRPVEFNEPIIDKSYVVDDRVLESYSPGLKALVDRGEVHTHAAFAIVEYFLRAKYHGLTDGQVVDIARIFPPRPNGETFEVYKERVEKTAQNFVVSGKSAEESWVIRREIMDLLEITELIKRKYLQMHTGKKTIFISDLMRISTEALRTVHQASSLIGVDEISQRDRQLLESNETTSFRKINEETVLKVLSRPDVFIPLLLSNKSRNLAEDLEKISKCKEAIQVEGIGNIPDTGPAIIAFSHMNRWKDKHVPPNWEMVRMIQEIQKTRKTKDVYVVAWLKYFRSVAPQSFPLINPNIIDQVLAKIRQTYSIHMLDPSAEYPNVTKFFDESKQALQKGSLVLISPEGTPAQEVLRPRGGVGVMARMSQAPVIGVAFREDKLPDGSFQHKVIFTSPRVFDPQKLPGETNKEKDQAFADQIMHDIAHNLPQQQRGVYQ